MANQKVFCIGPNKTGTTSLKVALNQLGLKVADQLEGEMLFFDWHKRDFTNIIAYCEKYEAFQDVPFSLPDTYQAVDEAFPGSKFILSLRSSPDQWYRSLTTYLTNKWSRSGQLPTAGELKAANNIFPGKPYYTLKYVFGVDDDDLFNKDILLKKYRQYTAEVIAYFRHRPDDLLILDIDSQNEMGQLTSFLGIASDLSSAPLPWENKSKHTRRAPN